MRRGLITVTGQKFLFSCHNYLLFDVCNILIACMWIFSQWRLYQYKKPNIHRGMQFGSAGGGSPPSEAAEEAGLTFQRASG